MKSFNGQINEFEEFQQNSARDMNNLNDQCRLYKELYQKECQQKGILLQKIQSGKFKSQPCDDPKERSKKRKKRKHVSENSGDETITYLSSPPAIDTLRDSTKRSSRSKGVLKKSTHQSSSCSPSPDPTFRKRSSKRKKRSSISPLQTYEQRASERSK